jgi:hypothetical protein
VYALTNLAAASYFARSGRFRVLRHGVLPVGGAALMVAVLLGQIVEQATAPYTWLPWTIVAWLVVVGLAAIWLARRRPEQLTSAGALLSSVEAEPTAAGGLLASAEVEPAVAVAALCR